MCLNNLSPCGIRNCKWNPQIVSGFPHKITEPTYICGIRLHFRNPEQLPIIDPFRIRNKSNVLTKLTLQISVRGNYGNFVNGILIDFGTNLNNYLWNPGTYRQKIVRLSKFTVWPHNVTDPNFLVKSLLAPIYTSFEGRSARQKTAVLVKTLQKGPYFETIFT